MPKKLAITVAGAVSLGAYEAGVLYEIVDAIGQHNQDPATAPADKIIIDVLTGASAGGISATVLAQKLLFEAGALADPYANTLYRAWVQDLQLEPLLALRADEDPSHSILSSDLVDTLSVKYLLQRYSTHLNLPIDPHPAASDRIRLGLALSNLNGVDYQYKMRPSGTFTYTRFQDEFEAEVNSGSDNDDFWEPLRKAAVSCSAFPFAFRVKDLVRHQSEYDRENLVTFPQPFETFTYTDGGTFQNQPLGFAKNLVDKEDPDHAGTDSRFYLFISPHDRSSDTRTGFDEAAANFLVLAGALVNAVFNQAGFQDWIRAEEINNKIDLFNTRATQLQTALMKGLDWAPLQAAADILLPGLLADPAASRKRLQQQFAAQYNALVQPPGPGPIAAAAWIDSILVLETAADLGEHDEMVIYGITANSSELAGAGLQAFLGFFKQEYRDHDYDVGRTKARAFLLGTAAQPTVLGTIGNLPAINYKPKPIHSIDPALAGLQLDKVPSELRQAMSTRLEDRANDLLKEANINAIERESIKVFVVRPQLKKLLKL